VKVIFLALGDRFVASSRARVYSYMPYLEGKGIRSTVIQYTSSLQCRKILLLEKQRLPEKMIFKIYSAFALLRLFALAPFFDIVYIQKVALSHISTTVLKALNKNIVFDFDDAIFADKDIGHILRSARCVVVSNDYLKKFSLTLNRDVRELISPVKIEGEGLQKEGKLKVRLGWIGSPETSKYLTSIYPVFESLKRNFTCLEIVFMGLAPNVSETMSSVASSRLQWSYSGERDYIKSLDIGIMPLTNDEHSRAKGGYKLLQYMASGIACVASPVGINRDIIKDGVNGYLAGSNEEWESKLSSLISDSSLREKMGNEGKRMARDFYSYEVFAPKLISIFEELVNS